MDTYIGFDSAWTDNPKASGAICAVGIEDGHPMQFHEPRLVSFNQALTFIRNVRSDNGNTLIALDQPTVVPNLTSMRPVERVAASLVSSAPTKPDRLTANQGLIGGQSIISEDGRFTFILQTDANLVLYGPGNNPLWHPAPIPIRRIHGLSRCRRMAIWSFTIRMESHIGHRIPPVIPVHG